MTLYLVNVIDADICNDPNPKPTVIEQKGIRY
jgi:hypothetical protein